ncbi:MAG: MFS transporter [Chloroflexi bacterium]|nr:MFS transporter [Chloroflexota bacterium]
MIDEPALEPAAYRRNFICGVGNSTLFAFGEALSSSSVVLPVYVTLLGGGPLLVGMLNPIAVGAWYLPQLFASALLQHQPRKLPYYVVFNSIRIAIWGLMGALTLLAPRAYHGLLLPAFISLLLIATIISGFSGLASMDLLGRIVQPWRRPAFFGWRFVFGGTLAVFSGALVKLILGWAPFPEGYGILFLMTFAIYALAVFIFSRVVEPPVAKLPPPVNPWQQLQRGMELLRNDPYFTRFLIARTTQVGSEMSIPFYIVFASQQPGFTEGSTGIYLSIGNLGAVVSVYFWSRISARHGNRPVLGGVSAVIFLAPLLAMAAPLINSAIPGAGFYVFGLVFACVGAFTAGANIGNPSLLLEIAPEHDRTIYIGLTNTFLGLAYIVSIAAGVIVALAGYQVLFLFSAFTAVLGVLYISLMRSPQERPEPVGQ